MSESEYGVVKLLTYILSRIFIEPTKPVYGSYYRDCFFRVTYNALAQTFCRGESHIAYFDNDWKPL